jgi:protein gp37
MSDKTKIEWTDATWNPIRGCSRVSEGCRNCYAEGVAARFSGTDKYGKPLPYDGLAERVVKPDGTTEARWTGKVVYAGDDVLMQPLKWKKPRRIFINSMSDLFHESVSDDVRDKVFAIVYFVYNHTYQLLTKRPDNMLEYMSDPTLPNRIYQAAILLTTGLKDNRDNWRPDYATGIKKRPNIQLPLKNLHLGVSVENQATANERIPLLLQTPAAVRFVSAEPLLGAIEFTDLDTNNEACMNALKPVTWQYIFDNHWKNTAEEHSIYSDMDCMVDCYDLSSPPDMNALVNTTLDWIIVGGESGKNARPMNPAWVRSIRDQCQDANVPFFFKQWGEFVSVSEVAGDGAHYKFTDGRTVRRTGKKLAGRSLDGVEHNAMPEVK